MVLQAAGKEIRLGIDSGSGCVQSVDAFSAAELEHGFSDVSDITDLRTGGRKEKVDSGGPELVV